MGSGWRVELEAKLGRSLPSGGPQGQDSPWVQPPLTSGRGKETLLLPSGYRENITQEKTGLTGTDWLSPQGSPP